MPMKSPSGSLCPYYYKGGELHPLHYGSYGNDMEKLSTIIEAEEQFILLPSSASGRRIWIDLYETKLSESMIVRLGKHITNISHKIFRLALVGCSKRVFIKVDKHLKDTDCHLAGQIRLFDDPEVSKDWLVGKMQ